VLFVTLTDCYSALRNEASSPLLLLPSNLRNILYMYSFDQANYRAEASETPSYTYYYHTTNEPQGLSQACTQLRSEILDPLNTFPTVQMFGKRTFTSIMTMKSDIHPLGTERRVCPTPHVYDKVTALEISASAIFDFNEVLFRKVSPRHVPEDQFRELASVFSKLDDSIVVDDCDSNIKDFVSAFIWVDIRMALSRRKIFSSSVSTKLEHRPGVHGIAAFKMRRGPLGLTCQFHWNDTGKHGILDSRDYS
jgi:hypothetical protein